MRGRNYNRERRTENCQTLFEFLLECLKERSCQSENSSKQTEIVVYKFLPIFRDQSFGLGCQILNYASGTEHKIDAWLKNRAQSGCLQWS